jgi:hypothetical protein
MNVASAAQYYGLLKPLRLSLGFVVFEGIAIAEDKRLPVDVPENIWYIHCM